MRVVLFVSAKRISVEGESLKCEIDSHPGVSVIRFNGRDDGYIEYANGSAGAYRDDHLYDRLIEIWRVTKQSQTPDDGQGSFNL